MSFGKGLDLFVFVFCLCSGLEFWWSHGFCYHAHGKDTTRRDLRDKDILLKSYCRIFYKYMCYMFCCIGSREGHYKVGDTIRVNLEGKFHC